MTGTECPPQAAPIRSSQNGRFSDATGASGIGLHAHEVHERAILDRLASSEPVTQRGLASELGIALGLTNLLIRRLVTKGWVRIKRVSPRRIRYLITPSGVSAQARLTRAYFQESLRYYRESRDRIRERLAALCLEHEGDPASGPIVFFGDGEVAEIAYVCLHETQLQLLGVVAPAPRGYFFRTEVHGVDDLRGQTLAGRKFWRLVVMSLQDEGEVRRVLAAHDVPFAAVFWL